MQQHESAAPTRTETVQAINRCITAYREIRAKLPKDAGYHDRNENQEEAGRAYLAKLPILFDPKSFQIYIACISHGASIGAIDPIDVGRFCHVASTAMAAWKLANLTIPAAEAKEARERGEDQETPLPSNGNPAGDNGNQPRDWESLYAATKLPDWETQAKLFQSLRDRGAEVPTDEQLRADPAAALRYCETAHYFMKCQQSSAEPPSREPGKEPAPDQQKPPAQAA